MNQPVDTSAPATSISGGRTITQVTEVLNRWRAQYNPLRSLSLRDAVSLAEDYYRGAMADLQWTYFFIEQTDPDLFALIEHRIGRLLQMDFHVKVPQHLDGADKTMADRQTAFLGARFDAIDNLYEAIEHLAMASFRGFAHCEKWYTAAGELTHLEIVDQWNCVRDGLGGAWKYNPKAKSATFSGLTDEKLMPPEAFVFRQTRRPIDRIALFKFVRASLSEKDWDAFVEIYGVPGGVVIGPPNVPPEKEAEYEAAAKDIADGGTGFLPYGSQYMTNGSADLRSRQPFKERLDHLSEKLILAGTGGKLTMLTEAGSGTLAGGAHADVFETIAAGEARRISEIFNEQLVEGWLNERFPDAKHFAYFELAAHQDADVGAIIDQIKTLADAGFQTDVAQVREMTGYTVTLKQVQPGFLPSGPAVTNRAAVAQAPAGIDQILAGPLAKTAILRPVINRLAALRRIADPDARGSALRVFNSDLPRIRAEIARQAPELTEAFEEIVGLVLGNASIQPGQETATK